MFQISINSIQKYLSIVRKQYFNENFNLIVDATRPTNANLSAEIFRWKIWLKSTMADESCIIAPLYNNVAINVLYIYWNICSGEEKMFSTEIYQFNIFHFNNHPLRWAGEGVGIHGIYNLHFCLLTLQMPHFKFGEYWSSSSWVKKNR